MESDTYEEDHNSDYMWEGNLKIKFNKGLSTIADVKSNPQKSNYTDHSNRCCIMPCNSDERPRTENRIKINQTQYFFLNLSKRDTVKLLKYHCKKVKAVFVTMESQGLYVTGLKLFMDELLFLFTCHGMKRRGLIHGKLAFLSFWSCLEKLA